MTAQETAARLVPLAEAHQQADEYIRGTYWNANTHKGCSVGCTIEDAKRLGIVNGVTHDDHAGLAHATGVPEVIWRWADHIFERLPDVLRSAWTPRLLRSISQSSDLGAAIPRINARLLERLAGEAIREDVRASAAETARLYRLRASKQEPTSQEWDAAWEQAYAAWKQSDAAWEQAYAAREQADAAWKQAYAAWKQSYAAWKQAYAARQQADAAREQADAAWKQADAAREQADAAWEQADAAWKQWWVWFADVMCEELTR